MRTFSGIVLVLLAAGSVVLSRAGMQSAQPPQEQTKIIDLKSDLSGPVAPGDSVIFMVGNFAAQHNGAVITCDSAVRYSATRVEFFGNVLINKNTTYIYGDRAEYNGELNQARVWSELIKVVDEDATLYTYEFVFDTRDNIGQFGGGGIMVNRDSRLESVRGYYYADTKELISVEQVEMRNDEYELRGDSVVYNMATDNAFFFENTNIWSHEGDYLYADRGAYDKADTLYKVTRNGYLLTEKQEMWSDSIDFYRAKDHVILWRDIQIDDTDRKTLCFGDYGEYWKEPGDAILTRRPSVISYDRSQGDSLFMRADSIFLFTIFRHDQAQGDSSALSRSDSLASVGTGFVVAGADAGRAAGPGSERITAIDSLAADGNGSLPSGDAGHRDRRDSLALARHVSKAGHAGDVDAGSDSLTVADSLSATGERSAADITAGVEAGSGAEGVVAGSDAERPATDSLAVEAADSVQLTPAEHKAQLKEAVRKAAAEKKAAAAQAKKAELDKIAARRQEKKTAKLLAEKEREKARLARLREKAEKRMMRRHLRASLRGKVIELDSTALHTLDSLIARNLFEQDSIVDHLVDSITTSTAMPIEVDSIDSPAAPADSMYRLVKGYRNVKMYRSDFQVVCDSMVSISSDSTIHLYIEPVLWNQANQITATVIDVYTANEQVEHAEFIGSPMMVSQIDTVHYNQVAGKEMVAYFFDNKIYRNDVNGNAQTIYYMEDGVPAEVVMMGVIESGDASFYIEENEVVQITYRSEPAYDFYPLDKIPPEQELYLQGFKWQGERRPSQAEVFDRKLRASQREVRTQLTHPDFPIMRRIEQHKKELIETRRWADRNERVDAQTVEWMRMLGYEVGQPREPREQPVQSVESPAQPVERGEPVHSNPSGQPAEQHTQQTLEVTKAGKR